MSTDYELGDTVIYNKHSDKIKTIIIGLRLSENLVKLKSTDIHKTLHPGWVKTSVISKEVLESVKSN